MNFECFDHWDKKIFLVDMKRELNKNFSELFDKWIRKYLSQKKKIGILINKKWFNTWVICHHCWTIPQCDRCSVAINYHILPNWEKVWICHICKKQYNYPKVCERCWNEEIIEFGIGTQKLAEILKEQYWAESLIIESETVNSKNKIEKFENKLNELSSNWVPPICIGTSLLTTPIKNWEFDLLIFLDADIWLNIPDYNANEKNFYFLYEAFVKHPCKNFIVQTLNPEQYSIRCACRLNKDEFFSIENEFLQSNNYPPFWEMCLILYKDEIEEKLYNKVDQLHKELLYLQEKYQLKDMEIYTTPPLIYKVFWKYRYNIILKWKEVRNFMDVVYTKLSLNRKGFKINWMPETMV